MSAVWKLILCDLDSSDAIFSVFFSLSHICCTDVCSSSDVMILLLCYIVFFSSLDSVFSRNVQFKWAEAFYFFLGFFLNLLVLYLLSKGFIRSELTRLVAAYCDSFFHDTIFYLQLHTTFNMFVFHVRCFRCCDFCCCCCC